MPDNEKAKDFGEISHPTKRAFLAAYCVTGTIRGAAWCADVTRQMHYNWIHEDSEQGELYRAAFDRARESFCDLLEEAAVKRAVEGVADVLVHGGEVLTGWVDEEGKLLPRKREGAKEIVLEKRRYSDDLLKVLLGANLPGKYRANDNRDKGSGEPEDSLENVIRDINNKLGNGEADEKQEDSEQH